MPLCMLLCLINFMLKRIIHHLANQSWATCASFHSPSASKAMEIWAYHLLCIWQHITDQLKNYSDSSLFILLFTLSLHREVCLIERSVIILLEYFIALLLKFCVHYTQLQLMYLHTKAVVSQPAQSKSKQLPLTLTISTWCMPRQKIPSVIFCRTDNEVVWTITFFVLWLASPSSNKILVGSVDASVWCVYQ